MKEITWYGRGGQGAFTASRILGAAAMLKGYKSLAFPSFGPERRGAPIRAFTKISREPVTDRSIIEKSDYAIVLDDTLFGEEILNSLKPEGLLLINTQGGKELPADERIRTVNVSEGALKVLGRNIVNIGILGAFAAADEEVGIADIEKAVREYMPKGLAEKNIQLLNEIFGAVGGKDDLS